MCSGLCNLDDHVSSSSAAQILVCINRSGYSYIRNTVFFFVQLKLFLYSLFKCATYLLLDMLYWTPT